MTPTFHHWKNFHIVSKLYSHGKTFKPIVNFNKINFISKTCNNFQTIKINLITSITVGRDIVGVFGLCGSDRDICEKNSHFSKIRHYLDFCNKYVHKPFRKSSLMYFIRIWISFLGSPVLVDKRIRAKSRADRYCNLLSLDFLLHVLTMVMDWHPKFHWYRYQKFSVLISEWFDRKIVLTIDKRFLLSVQNSNTGLNFYERLSNHFNLCMSVCF